MQRRHSSNTDGMPSERNRSQTLGSESSLDDGGVFDCLKPESSASPQQMFSGLVGVPSSAVSSAHLQAAGLFLGSPPEVFIQMTASSREEAGSHRTEGGPFLTRPPQHHHHFHHQPLQHRTSSLLQQATTAASSERHGSREDAQDEQSTPAPALSELKSVVTWLQRGFPFILILLAKVCFQHKLGIAVCVGMISTFAYANSTFKHQVSLRIACRYLQILQAFYPFSYSPTYFFLKWNKLLLAVVRLHGTERSDPCLWLFGSSCFSGGTSYISTTPSARRSCTIGRVSVHVSHVLLIFAKPNLNSFDFFDLIWAVGITDFVLKYVTIGLKCSVLFLPKMIMAFKSRGKFYLLIEELSQLFRALVPVQLWYKYIMGEDPSNSYFLGAALIIIYSLCKSFDLCGRVSAIRKALVMLCSSQSYGVRASNQLCSEAGDVCAICQGDFKDPIALICQHVFCEECLCLWFDRERTCPLCRSTVVEALRCWKDGTTSAHFQIY